MTMPPDERWRFLVWGPTGAGPTTITADDSVLDPSGMRAQLYPEGDTREVALSNRGLPRDPTFGIPSLAAVQFQRWNPDTLDWVAYWYAQVRQGGNLRNETGESMVLRSLSLRLGEVPLSPDFTTPMQSAHLAIRALIQDVLPGLDGLILYDEALCPDLGFNARAVENANQQNPLALLQSLREQGLASSPPVDIRFGVNAQRTFYCVLAREDVLALASGDDGDVLEEVWKEPVAEKPCTLVKWFIGRRADGTWITYDSLSPLRNDLGLYYKPVAIGSDLNPWALVSGTYQYVHDGTVETVADNPVLYDGKAGAVTGFGGASAVTFVQFTPAAGETWTRAVIAGAAQHGGGLSQTLVSVKPAAATFLTVNADDQRAGGWLSTTVYARPDTPFVQAPYIATGLADPDTLANVQIAELRVERLDTDLLDRLARFHFAGPASEPADLTLRTLLWPDALAGRITLRDYARPVEVYELRMNDEAGLQLAVLTGQADDPGKLAQASLIKARDQAAVISALTARR